jgi:DNA-directed RNA polymerase specialized sigma24 family protein
MRDELEREYVEYVSERLRLLHRAAYLLCGDAHRADDVVQATIVALYQHWSKAKAADNTEAYVHRMLVRKYLDERRRPWARVRLLADDLRQALSQLSVTQRTVLVLRFACDLSIEDVAGLLRCSSGDVKSHTSRGPRIRRTHPPPASAGPRAMVSCSG